MLPTRQSSFRLFRLAGIDVYLHWSWFLVAAYEATTRTAAYSSISWNVLEYLALFLIVLLHEFGHALACRQVGGEAHQIILWPLGGVAYVMPPRRPGATLWSIAAGPLVNLVLVLPLTLLLWLSQGAALGDALPGARAFLQVVWVINLVLLIFNLLPIYPLDGGQILRALLWFLIGPARSLLVTTALGFVGVAALAALALWMRSVWLGILCVFILLNCWRAWLHARSLARAAAAPRHAGFSCPSCHTSPPVGAFWLCGRCRKPFDTFASQATCPNCAAQYGVSSCPECGGSYSMDAWISSHRV